MSKEKELDRAKSEFVSLASHQLRTPLTGIEWIAEAFAKKEKLTAQGKEYLNDIRFSAKRLNALIKLLLNASRIESGAVGVSPETFELVEFIKAHIKECQMLCEKKNLTHTFDKHPEKILATTDKTILGYILQNLMGNAIEYTLAGGKVEVMLEKKEKSALLTIQDTGIGVPKDVQTRIFEKFFRASNAVAMKPDGTGLGLYIVSEAVKLLEGKIWFESPASPAKRGEQEGKGSVFYVELPLVVQPHTGEKVLTSKFANKGE